jgi:hypothetical protein
LSAYRVHGANYFAARESLLRLRSGRPEFAQQAKEEDRELIRFLFQRASYFEEILSGKRFWHIIDQLSVKLRQKGKFLSDRRSLELFIYNYETLRQAFGEADLLANLRRRLVTKDVRAVIREAHGGRTPPRVRLALLRGEAEAVRHAMEKSIKRAVKKTKKIVAGKRASEKRPKKVVAGKRRTAVERQQQKKKNATSETDHAIMEIGSGATAEKSDYAPVNFGPAAVVSHVPPICMTGMPPESETASTTARL